MRFRDLTEANLPLRKGEMPNARGGYGAFVIVLHPADFIRLTTPADEVQSVYDETKVDLDTYKSGSHERHHPNNYNMPFLNVEFSTGRVKGHEGRHRAAMVEKAGGKSFPCVVYLRHPMSFTVSFVKEPMDVALGIEEGDEERCTNTFNSMREAEEFVEHLKQLRQEEGHEFFYSGFKIDSDGGHKMKGSPRSEGWDYDAWTKEDMPAKLVGQYETSVVVTNFRVGLVKGYRHFKR